LRATVPHLDGADELLLGRAPRTVDHEEHPEVFGVEEPGVLDLVFVTDDVRVGTTSVSWVN